jgi:hypothetical protein
MSGRANELPYAFAVKYVQDSAGTDKSGSPSFAPCHCSGMIDLESLASIHLNSKWPEWLTRHQYIEHFVEVFCLHNRSLVPHCQLAQQGGVISRY